MFKSFAASLLFASALAIGDADGTSAANAYVTTLIDSADEGLKLSVYTYNKVEKGDTRAEDSYEFHGNTHVATTKPLLSTIRYGWCIENTAAVEAAPAKEAIEAVPFKAAVVDADGNETSPMQPEILAEPAQAEVVAADATWDCQEVLANLNSNGVADPTTTDWYNTFQVTDMHYTGTHADWTYAGMKKDALSDTTEPDVNWNPSKSKSYKECEATDKDIDGMENAIQGSKYQTVGDNATSVWVACGKDAATQADQVHSEDAETKRYGVNNHWFRNFATTQKDTDMQLSIDDDALLERPIFGFIAEYGRVQANEPADRRRDSAEDQKMHKGAILKVKPISEKWSTDQKALIKAEEDAAAKAKKDAEDKANEENKPEGDDDDHEGHDHDDDGKKDGAAQIAAHTTAFIVAVSALAF